MIINNKLIFCITHHLLFHIINLLSVIGFFIYEPIYPMTLMLLNFILVYLHLIFLVRGCVYTVAENLLRERIGLKPIRSFWRYYITGEEK